MTTHDEWGRKMATTARQITVGPWNFQTATWQVGTGLNAYLTALQAEGWLIYSITPAGNHLGHDHVTVIHQRPEL